MKMILAIAMIGLFLGTNSWADPTYATSLYCQNQHVSILDLELSGKLTLQDLVGSFTGGDALSAYYHEKYPEDDSYGLEDLQLKIPAADLSCSPPVLTLFSCRGRSKNATLSLHPAWAPWINLQAEVVNIEINSTVRAAGPIPIGQGGASVTLDTTQVEASADISLEGRPFHLEWSPSFKNCLQQ